MTEEVGRRPATVDEARAMLGITPQAVQSVYAAAAGTEGP